MIVLLGLELVTGSFALVPLARLTLGNLVDGFVFTGLALYTTFKRAAQPAPALSVAIQASAE
jgi:formate/nitrite transporter FocA (FNT family)